MNIQELKEILSNAYDKNSNILNAAIRSTYKFSEQISKLNSDEKERILFDMLSADHIYVQYWGAIIALSYDILKKDAITVLIKILDLNPYSEKNQLRLNCLKMDIETALYDLKKYGCIGSYPGQYSYSPSIVPNTKSSTKYFRKYIGKL